MFRIALKGEDRRFGGLYIMGYINPKGTNKIIMGSEVSKIDGRQCTVQQSTFKYM